MKKTLLTLALVAAATVSSFAQGTINPLNGTLTRIKVDLNGDGVAERNGTASDNIVFSLYWGPAGTTPETLAGEFRFGTSDGILVGPSSLALEGAGEVGTVVSLQMRVTSPGWQGATDIKQVTLTAPPPAAAQVIWTSGTRDDRFSPLVVTVPEPSTIALGVLGLGSLLLFRRRK